MRDGVRWKSRLYLSLSGEEERKGRRGPDSEVVKHYRRTDQKSEGVSRRGVGASPESSLVVTLGSVSTVRRRVTGVWETGEGTKRVESRTLRGE